jgi:hypothetical protein
VTSQRQNLLPNASHAGNGAATLHHINSTDNLVALSQKYQLGRNGIIESSRNTVVHRPGSLLELEGSFLQFDDHSNHLQDHSLAIMGDPRRDITGQRRESDSGLQR